MTSRFYSLMLSSVAALISVAAFAEKKPFGSARKYATGGEITRFCYTDKFGIGYTAFIHTFTNTDTVAEFKNKSGKALPVRILAVGGGGAGMDGMRVTTPGTARRPGGGGGGGGGVTEMNAVLPATDTWTIRVGKGGTIGTGSEAYKQPRGESGASCVSNENTDAEVILVPGGGAGGGVRGIYAVIYPTVGAAGGGGAGSNSDEALGSNGVYSSSIMGVIPDGAPFSGGNGGPSWATAYGGGGGGAGAPGEGENGGEGLASDITGVYVVYGSGGGGGGHSRLNYKEPGWDRQHDGGVGGTNAGNGGNCEWDISEDGSITNIVVTKATPPLQNSGSGGGGGVSFGGGANFDDFGREYVPATPGADGVVIIRYDIPDAPCCIGGDIVTAITNGLKVTYIHTFTNTSEALTFKPVFPFSGSVRLLAVGGGGAGMDGLRPVNNTDRRPGGGGGGGGGVTEINATLPATDVWTIRVGKGGTVSEKHESYKNPRGESSASCVSNESTNAEIVLVPGGGAGGNYYVPPTVGAAGGGGAGLNKAAASGTNGVYQSSIMGVVSEGAPFAGGNGGPSWDTAYGGGGGGAGAPGEGENGGEGLASDITGVYVVYGSGGGGGGHSRLNYKDPGWERRHDGGVGGTNAGNGGNCEWDISEDGSITNIVVIKATPPLQNSGCGGGGGVSFGGGANFDDFGREYFPATSGADGVVIIRYDSVLSHPQGTVIVIR